MSTTLIASKRHEGRGRLFLTFCPIFIVLCPRNALDYSDAVQSLFVSQTDAERRVKNHRLSEGLKARVSVI